MVTIFGSEELPFGRSATLPVGLQVMAPRFQDASLLSVAMGIEDGVLSPVFQRTRRNGTVEEINVRWVLYHMLEHFSGHYGQILLLRHQYRDAAK